MKLIVKPLTETAVIPTYGSNFSAGLDLRADEDCVVEAGKRMCISTGISLQWIKNKEDDEEPENFYMRIASRSGLTIKNGINVGAGVVDADFRGEVKVILFNHNDIDLIVNKGDRIAQAILTRIERFDEIVLSNELSNTERGEKGFGSTGIK